MFSWAARVEVCERTPLQVLERYIFGLLGAKLREVPEFSSKNSRYIYECKLLRVFCPALILSVDSTGAG